MRITGCLRFFLALTALLAADAAGAPFQRGMSYTPWDNDLNDHSTSLALEESLDDLAEVGANWAALNIFEFQDDLTSTTIAPRYDEWSTDTASIQKAVNELRGRGMNVLLKANVDVVSGEWRGQIENSAAWFDGYRDFIYDWADWAQIEGVDAFTVGCEFKNTTDAESSWRDVVSGIRTRFSGPLVYAANWDNYQNVAWWDSLDYIGIDAYFPLTSETDPTAGELAAAWDTRADQIESWLAGLPPDRQKSVLFTEIGYRSLDGANQAPYQWSPYGTDDVDLQEQADSYEAALEATWDRPWMEGYHWWNWETSPDAGIDPTTGLYLNDYTPQNKPALDVLQSAYVPEPSAPALLCLGLIAVLSGRTKAS